MRGNAIIEVRAYIQTTYEHSLTGLRYIVIIVFLSYFRSDLFPMLLVLAICFGHLGQVTDTKARGRIEPNCHNSDL